jgi:hypothetical protein
MKKFFLISAVAFFATIFSTTIASAQMVYQNGALSMKGTATFTGNARFMSKVQAPTVYSNSNYILCDAPNASAYSIGNATSKILQLRPVQWRVTLPGGGGGIVIGPFALTTDTYPNKGFRTEELKSAFPGSISTGDNGETYMNYNAIIPYLVAAIQEQNARIVTLEAEVAALKRK